LSLDTLNKSEVIWWQIHSMSRCHLGVNINGKGQLQFIKENTNVNADYLIAQPYTGRFSQFLWKWFVFQNMACIHMWFGKQCPDFSDKNSWL